MESFGFVVKSFNKIGREHHTCVYHEGKVIVAGGIDSMNKELSSTEILEMNGDEIIVRKGGNMVGPRASHGMGIVAISKSSSILIVLGGTRFGNSISDVEVWDPAKETWILTHDMELSKAMSNFVYVTVPKELICSAQKFTPKIKLFT